ncbi:hypothetical protein TNCV_4530931 [Trichonephila clavipes]|nr:hypothetical protein TNCV_4530931 [Trichonephila clavipes]
MDMVTIRGRRILSSSRSATEEPPCRGAGTRQIGQSSKSSHWLLEGDASSGPKREIRRSPNVSFNTSIVARAVTCCAVLLEPQLLDIMIVQFKNEKVSNHGSIPITIDCNVVAFIVFEEGFHQRIKRTKQSVFLDVTVFRLTLVD